MAGRTSNPRTARDGTPEQNVQLGETSALRQGWVRQQGHQGEDRRRLENSGTIVRPETEEQTRKSRWGRRRWRKEVVDGRGGAERRGSKEEEKTRRRRLDGWPRRTPCLCTCSRLRTLPASCQCVDCDWHRLLPAPSKPYA